MSGSQCELPAQVEKWTTKDVARWLTSEVQVDPTFADKFEKEDVCGEFLLTFEKKEILEMGIKHGPAVKIARYLERLKKKEETCSGSESRMPCLVERWTKEEVYQWLVKNNNQFAEQLLQEDVSGDCLLCFGKKDFKDIGIKTGPAVHILKKLSELKDQMEPNMISDQQKVVVAKTHKKADSKKVIQNARQNISDPRPNSQIKLSKSKQVKDPVQQVALHRSTIQNILEELAKDDFKKFQYFLQDKKNEKNVRIPWGKLENKDTMDTAKLLSDHHGDQALTVTRDVLVEINQYDLASRLENIMVQLGQLKCCSEESELKREFNQGEKLKNLLTCGGNSLESYERFVVVANKSSPEQVQHLQFLTKLQLLCVLDFDPNSNRPHGLCHTYKETRVANLHSPSQYQGPMNSVVSSLNLYDQTSWVFCNGRHDLESDANKELDYTTWLKKSCKDVEQLVAFICNQLLCYGRGLIVFLLLSPVDTDNDPFFETYRSFLKHTEEQSIITICESASSYAKWKELIVEKFHIDIDPISVYELTLSQVNGTVMGLGPFSQSPAKLLPSSDSSSVVLKQKDEDLLTALDILSLNQCENVFEDESGPKFLKFRMQEEEEFYRGGKVKWWNFYFCDKDSKKIFVKRDKYRNVMDMIRSQHKYSRNACVLLNFFHHPGCGASTLAMHILWDLRNDFRCAVLKDTPLPKEEVADQIIHLMKLESGTPSPVLLLMDDLKETDSLYDLVNCIRKAVEDSANVNVDHSLNCKVIILNCVRSHSPKEQYKRDNSTQCQYITASLSAQEKEEFEKKLEELQETHEKPENFYTFMIMKSNFDQKYIKDLARNTLKNFAIDTDDAKLFAFLALLNTYVPESGIALSLCEDFFGVKMARHPEDCVLDTMKIYSNVLIVDRVEECGGYKTLRILHHTIADACLEELEGGYSLMASDITLQMLHYDLFFSKGVVKDRLMASIERMLIRRRRKKDSDDREPFSPLIDKIHQQQGGQTVQEIFVKASSRYSERASIPQALARYLYINERDFPEALKWAEKAKNIAANPYIVDTIGQVYKSNLRSNMDKEKQETSHNPEDLHTNICLAINGIRAFQRAQEQSDRDDNFQVEKPDDESDDFPRKSYNIFGHVGVLEMSFLVFEILAKLPFFEERHPMKKKYLQSFLNGSIPISSVHKDDNQVNNRYAEIIKDHEQFLVHLKPEVKKKFDFLNCYFTYTKGNSEFDKVNNKTVCDHFKKYVNLFCTEPKELKKVKDDNPKLNLELLIEERKKYLEKTQADTFSGILQYLDRSAEEMEKIVNCYLFLQQTVKQKQNIQMKINYILANVVLYLLNPKSKHLQSYQKLCDLLLEALQAVGHHHTCPDPYYLALLMFWPTRSEENSEIRTYVSAIRSSSRKHMSKLFYKRSTVAHLYLGRENGLKRLVSKPSLDKNFLTKMKRDFLAQLWWNGDIFKEKDISSRLVRVGGTIEQGVVFATYSRLKIPVHPARWSGIRSGCSTEKISFYLGFAINGPLAYDIQYEN
ncbi:sterile alpha motif domain-containing protein 9 isoform X1 [Entelurus aequoreus]|uniref:sterile alpha motif domain-containing protein 9 isoform X1 n=1 Tax=Entelurus aequoreus TaxID=161455 RepID=UPI002B1E1E12|nr:sterile alpha motif domain-containing protein 9 isoform X1 [Entelurus aequoreus]XP_061895145.1 sterile alpha motif domain-containing protein 9 isoform X1 [Entelurus aequoreus]XP_061895146.1 sterile alpha motif domain-containing protein 9 isoform X1 [Entelurus aequoreus]XP_061895147.1 sterile alpha motif domain-containing protein 9 isoform X1 [Entelurus aequoreus]XP_061895148.1 sterile alpha motif domain-containing protein 9 isoform X1 [Entelurus aequoreus]XP_061895149.1 sterile alpha motif 